MRVSCTARRSSSRVEGEAKVNMRPLAGMSSLKRIFRLTRSDPGLLANISEDLIECIGTHRLKDVLTARFIACDCRSMAFAVCGTQAMFVVDSVSVPAIFLKSAWKRWI